MTKLSAAIFNTSLQKPKFVAFDIKKSLQDGTSFKIYPISELHKLIEVVRKKSAPLLKIRYLVDMNNQLWFAEEGGAGRTIPAHYQMGDTEWCITAGNIKFSKDYKQIELINHKSSFKPSLDSIKWVVAILIANEELLNEQSISLSPLLVINELTSSGGNKEAHILEKIELAQWISGTFGEEYLGSFKKQPLTIKETTYTEPTRVYPTFNLFPLKPTSSDSATTKCPKACPEKRSYRITFYPPPEDNLLPHDDLLDDVLLDKEPLAAKQLKF
jgi:hypothetical protein